MKRFINYILLFSSVILILGIAMEYMLRQVPNIYKFKKELIESKSKDIHTLIIGSSVVNCSLDPSYMQENTYNLAISGEWNRFNKIFLEKNIDQLTNLKSVIWGQCYQSLWMDDTAEFSEQDIISHQLYMDIKTQNNWLHSLELISLKAVSLRKWSKYYILKKSTMNCDSLGIDHSFDSQRADAAWKQDVPGLVKKQTNWMWNDKQDLYSQNLERIKDVAILCQNKGISLFLVVPPVCQSFYCLAEKEQVEKLKEGFKTIEKEFNNVYFLNYLSDKRFTDKDFYDGIHLNSDIGAIKFTKILQKDMEKIKGSK